MVRNTPFKSRMDYLGLDEFGMCMVQFTITHAQIRNRVFRREFGMGYGSPVPGTGYR